MQWAWEGEKAEKGPNTQEIITGVHKGPWKG